MKSATYCLLFGWLPLASMGVPAYGEDCAAPPEWFAPSGTPRPANSKPDPDSDCAFYTWAWQTFLYVTQSDQPGGPARFLAYETNIDLFGAKAAPRFPLLSAAQRQSGVTLRLAPRLGKSQHPLDFDSATQAGGHGILVDQNGRAIYYAIHLNEVFVNFVKSNGYTDADKLENAPPDQEFPRGSLELKSSWKILSEGVDASGYFTANAVISELAKDPDPTNPNGIIVSKEKTRTATVALVGLHVVGVVDGHPEFVWATFEHNDNAPDVPADMRPTAANPSLPNTPVDSHTSWTLYPKGALASDCNRKATISTAPPLQLDEATQALTPKTSVARVFPFGDDDDPATIRNLNKSVHQQMPADLAVWKNYSLMGAVWLNNTAYFREGVDFVGLDAADLTKKILGGDKKLSNTTMETFTQTTKGCFNCHCTQEQPVEGTKLVFPPKRIGVSHAIVNGWAHLKQHSSSSGGK